MRRFQCLGSFSRSNSRQFPLFGLSGHSLSIRAMILSAIRTLSAMAATCFGEAGPPFQSASLRAARMLAAIKSPIQVLVQQYYRLIAALLTVASEHASGAGEAGIMLVDPAAALRRERQIPSEQAWRMDVARSGIPTERDRGPSMGH